MLDRESEIKSPERFRRRRKSSERENRKVVLGRTTEPKGFSEHLVILESARIVLVTYGIFLEKI